MEGALSGPLRRGDAATIRAHLDALEPVRGLAALYRALGRELLELELGLAEPARRELRELLG